MTLWLRRHGYALVVGVLSLAILLAGAFVLVIVLPDLWRPSVAPSRSPEPSPSTRPAVMAWLPLPDDADCAACHLTANGAVGLREVPGMAHPLAGWTNCTECHADDRLVETAPGHTSIHATECLLCHQPAQLPEPLSRPHRELQNQECLNCHGGGEAPLPADMAHRPEQVCWLCHRLPQIEPPYPDHEVSAGQTDCLTCHRAGDVGALPADHETRDGTQCLLCHTPPDEPSESPRPAAGPPVPLGRAGWSVTPP
jgi:hypothetical protein